MKRCLLLFCFLSAMINSGLAQQYYYDIWFDSNRSAMTHGKFKPGDNTLKLDMSGIKTGGLHFLNVIPYSEGGERGQWRCIPFIVPDGWPYTSNASTIECWVYGYDTKPIRIPYDGSTYQVNIDISKMSYGLHFLNVRCFNEAGVAGPWKQIAFYISNHLFDKEPMSFQYWIDQGEVKIGSGYMPGEVSVIANLEGLSMGQHSFYYRICYSGDPKASGAEFGPTKTFNFEVPPQMGDVNADNYLNAKDVIEEFKYMLNKPSANFKSQVSDMNSDRKVNIADIIQIVNKSLGTK